MTCKGVTKRVWSAETRLSLDLSTVDPTRPENVRVKRSVVTVYVEIVTTRAIRGRIRQEARDHSIP
jgi:hypothetical protein